MDGLQDAQNTNYAFFNKRTSSLGKDILNAYNVVATFDDGVLFLERKEQVLPNLP